MPGEREIIELQDVRMSPIAPIRRRPGTAPPHDPARFPPSFRMARGPAATAYHSARSAHGLRYRGELQKFHKKKKNNICNIIIQLYTNENLCHRYGHQQAENVARPSSWSVRHQSLHAEDQRRQRHRQVFQSDFSRFVSDIQRNLLGILCDRIKRLLRRSEKINKIANIKSRDAKLDD